MSNTIESKVYAATLGSGAGTILSGFLLWILGVTFWGASSDAAQSVTAASAVPAPVAALVTLLLTIGGAFAAGYAAPHTSRPDVTGAPGAGEITLHSGVIYSEGGTLPAGVSTVTNSTGTPEPVVAPAPVEPPPVVPPVV